MRIVDTRHGSFLKKGIPVKFPFYLKKSHFFLTESNLIVGMGEKLHVNAKKMRQIIFQ